MNIGKISIKNFRYKPLYTFLGVLMLSVSIALLLGIQKLDRSLKNQMENNLGNIDMVVGAKGSPLQLVLASVLHIDNPTGNISCTEAKTLAKNPMVEKAVPISYGDNYQGYRIVGTTKDFAFLYGATLDKGKNIERSMEVILGATLAERTNLKIGDTFQSSHGLAVLGSHEHDDLLTVVGIYRPTGKVIDRLLVTPLETIWDVHHHEENGKEVGHQDEHVNPDHDSEEGHHDEDNVLEEENKEITSLLVSFRNPMALLNLPRAINENTNMQAALPKFELDRLYQFTGVGIKVITGIAYAILAISCITIFVSLYRMVRDRAFDLALMRTYGASNFQLIKMVAYEGLLVAAISFLIGTLLSYLGIYLIFKMIADQYKQQMPIEFGYQEFLPTGFLVLTMVLFAIVFAIYPIVKMNISKILSHEK
ncbi:ABC transporter permease [Maribacter flavus]|uniref:FtsX-like permease family protein n=1 Tax=Maribacter flavus TaxID=1658664 RepID=A0A5B2TX05_9FLAO|nr:FtsX-like permease family protein [Maribacter flavus]KAA2218673.1 FtsX-like permease family protein [Maribacter flavus]